ncbi:MAG: ATP-binding protein [Candidatus Aureabacteria bacterium]|nr:ATP-binding protein [Candidatus Auribacterota bacterium]
MQIAKKYKIEVKKDHLSKIASGSPEFALAELIWNALDADANNIEVCFHEGPLGVDEILIRDNGTGIAYDEAENLFVSLGGSWKAQQQKTKKGRFLHGKDGEGRFKAFILGRIVDWNIIYKKDSQFLRYTIEECSDSLDEFSLSAEEGIINKQTGVEVHITELNKKFHVLNKEKAIEKLTPIFALYLSNYPSVKLSIDGTPINPDEVILHKNSFSLDTIKEDGSLHQVELEVVEWCEIKERELWFCNAHGFPLEVYSKQIRGIGEFGFSGYIKSTYIQHLHSHGLLTLGELNKNLNQACEQAVKKIKDYFIKRTLESARDQLEKWKEEKVYPYVTEPATPVEVAERQVFDIIAININQSLPDFEQTEKKTKAFQLRMLRQAVEKSPEELQIIIGEVLQLPKKKQEQLAELLKDTSLSGIISASKLVTDRLKFLSGLEHMLFDKDVKKHFKERTQLHRILADNTWVFGHAFSLSVDDKSLTEVLRKHINLSGNNLLVDAPVKRLDESIGIVDLMLSRSIPRNHSNELEHLVVELKAPRIKIGQKEIEQIKSYAFAAAGDERFQGLKTRWHFWVISNDIDNYAEIELSQEKYEDGIIFKTTKNIDLTIWVKTWSQLLQENKHRLEFIKEKLNYNIDREDALAYLKKTYEEYTQGLIFPQKDGQSAVNIDKQKETEKL